MASAESAYSDAGDSKHSLDRDCPLLVGRKNAEIFDAILDEFAGGEWPFPSARELPTASPFTDEDYYGCERGHSGFFASETSTSSVITGVDSPPQIPLLTAESCESLLPRQVPKSATTRILTPTETKTAPMPLSLPKPLSSMLPLHMHPSACFRIPPTFDGCT
jgi:hypothetical protein